MRGSCGKSSSPKGGGAVRKHPIYMILGDSPAGPHDLRLEYEFKIVIPLDRFAAEEISFTYPDSLYQVPMDDLGRLYLERCADPAVYRLEEIARVIERYQVYEQNNHYVEAQVWVDRPLEDFRDQRFWQASGAVGSGRSGGRSATCGPLRSGRANGRYWGAQ